MLMIVFSPSFLKLGLIMLVLGGLVMGLVTKLRKLFKKNKKAFFIYTLLTILVFGLTALLSNDRVLQNSPLANFISFQVLFLIYGSVHVFIMRKFFDNILDKLTEFWPEFFYTVVIGFLGLIGFIFTVQFYKLDYMFTFLGSAICFLIPYLVVKLYEFAVTIPVPVYNKWMYPLGKNIKDPKESELKNPVVISFEFNKEIDSSEISNFRLKAPEQMEFGKLFYFFINDYNERHPENQIAHLDKDNKPYEWVFYSKPNFLGNRKYYDFNKTVDANSIKENEEIICQRA